jgi:hypothetical protein
VFVAIDVAVGGSADVAVGRIMGVSVGSGAGVSVAVGVAVGTGDSVGEGVQVGRALALRVARLLTAVPVAARSGAGSERPQAPRSSISSRRVTAMLLLFMLMGSP